MPQRASVGNEGKTARRAKRNRPSGRPRPSAARTEFAEEPPGVAARGWLAAPQTCGHALAMRLAGSATMPGSAVIPGAEHPSLKPPPP
jgi:hypothetical protein